MENLKHLASDIMINSGLSSVDRWNIGLRNTKENIPGSIDLLAVFEDCTSVFFLFFLLN